MIAAANVESYAIVIIVALAGAVVVGIFVETTLWRTKQWLNRQPGQRRAKRKRFRHRRR